MDLFVTFSKISIIVQAAKGQVTDMGGNETS